MRGKLVEKYGEQGPFARRALSPRILSMKFTVNPDLVLERIDGEFYAAANPLVRDGLRVVNSIQHRAIQLLAAGLDLSAIAKETALTPAQVRELFTVLLDRKIVSDDGDFGEPKGRFRPRSLSLWVQTTNACNLRCGYCYIHVKDRPAHMDAAAMEKLRARILATVKARELVRVSLRLSGGEPMLVARPWMDFIRRVRDDLLALSCEFRPVFLTNGTLISGEVMDFLAAERLPVAISLDGLKEEQDAARVRPDGSGSFDAVMKAMDALRERGISFSVMTVLSDANIPRLPRITDFLAGMNVRFRYSIADGVALDYPLLFRQFHKSLEVLEKHVDRGFVISKRFKLCDLKFTRPSPRACSSGHNGGAVYLDGGIYFCQKHFGAGGPLGSLDEKEDILSVASRGSRYLSLPGECARCSYRLVCSGGCPLERKGGINPECAFYREFIPKIYRLMGKERLREIKSGFARNKG